MSKRAAVDAAAIHEPLPWIGSDGVQGLGLGEKVTDGRKLDRLSLRVYVERKRPLAELEHPVPAVVELETGPVPTDVVEIGTLAMEQLTARARPIAPGCGVSHLNVGAGTLGCLVRKSGDPSRRFILSNAHVLADSGLGQAGNPILQPAIKDGGRAGDDMIARLSEFVPYDYSQDGFSNLVDAAIAEITLDVAQVSPLIQSINIGPKGVLSGLRRGMRVQKVGRTTGHTWGTILDTDFQAIVEHKDPAMPGRKAKVLFGDQVLCSRYTDEGDSGALVLSSGGFAVGLHFAGSASASVFNRIGHVLAALAIELEA